MANRNNLPQLPSNSQTNKSSETSSTAYSYVVINNIPKEYHSSHLRNFFSQMVETRGFRCFHFRHRPEVKISLDKKSNPESNSRCCVVKLTPENAQKFVKMYHRRHWLKKNGESMAQRCFIAEIDDINPSESATSRNVKVKEKRLIPSDRETFTVTDLQNLPELHPPAVMPYGNVGTPSNVFMQLIQDCRLPPSIINKLGLTFPRTRTGRFSSVPFTYDTKYNFKLENAEYADVTISSDDTETENLISSDATETDTLISSDNTETDNLISSDNTETDNLISSDETETDPSISSDATGKDNLISSDTAETDNDGGLVISGDGHVITASDDGLNREKDDKELGGDLRTEKMKNQGEITQSGSHDDDDDDDDTCEEWERHEALNADEFQRSRTKERVYEEKIELQWEKGGSGLVFYTDNYRWKQEEGDFDEQTADDWDVDMSVYYDPEEMAGDKDARDFISIRASERRRKGQHQNEDLTFGGKIGKFEKHTKGIGRKVLESQGWKEGSGLGSWQEGMLDALENDGQPGHVKTGIGYRGEKLNRYPVRPPPAHLISTVYDGEKLLNERESDSLYRRHGELVTSMKYRTFNKYNFAASTSTLASSSTSTLASASTSTLASSSTSTSTSTCGFVKPKDDVDYS